MICNEDRRIVGIWAELGLIPNDASTLAFAAALMARLLAEVDALTAGRQS